MTPEPSSRGKLQDALDRQIAKIPRLGIESVVREKLLAEGIQDEAPLGRLMDLVMGGKAGVADIACGRSLQLEFTETDLKRVEEAAAALIERMPTLIEKIASDIGTLSACGTEHASVG